MLFCDQPSLEQWSPDFSSSGQANPVWTRVRNGQTELCNWLEGVECGENPVQVEICDACGTTDCAAGGYVHVSALPDVVLWTMPRLSGRGLQVMDRLSPAAAIVRFGSVALPANAWNAFPAIAPDIPEAQGLAPADGRAVSDAWIAGHGRPDELPELLPWLQARLLGCDSIDTATALKAARYWAEWFTERCEHRVQGVIRPVESAGAKIERLYFDGPASEDWAAFAEFGGSLMPALGHTHFFSPT